MPLRSYLVMPFMGTDLGKLMKLERLSEDRVQFLVYQMLKGLKVNETLMKFLETTGKCFSELIWCPLSLLSPQYIHSAGIIHRVGDLWPFRLWALGVAGLLSLFLYSVPFISIPTQGALLCECVRLCLIRWLLDRVIEMSIFKSLSLIFPASQRTAY